MKKIILCTILFTALAMGAPQTVTFTPSDADGSLSFVKNVSTVDLTFSSTGFLSYDGDGIYAYTGTDNAIALSIDITNGYSFDINRLWVTTSNASVTFQLTYADNSTTQFTKSGITTGSSVEVSGINFPINNVKHVVISCIDYATINSIEFDDIRAALPVELTAFTAKASMRGIHLNWRTATEVNNYGFDVERASATTAPVWEKIGFTAGAGNSSAPREYAFDDAPLAGKAYTYRLKQIDVNGAFVYSPVVEASVQAPLQYSIRQNFPNPFNPTTRIQYSIPAGDRVRITVYDIQGKDVASLVDEVKEAGTYDVEFDASELPSGVYFYKLVSGRHTEMKSMVLIR